MKERPIPFSAPMVGAILEGRKTQTRRVVKPATLEAIEFMTGRADGEPARSADLGLFYDRPEVEDSRGRARTLKHPQWMVFNAEYPDEGSLPIGQGHGAVGDRLYIREAYKVDPTFNARPPSQLPNGTTIYYLGDNHYSPPLARYRHARFMPRWASRINLEVTGVRVERLQEISETDAKAEGAAFTCPQCGNDLDDEHGAECHWQCDEDDGSHREGFQRIWHAINGLESWAANPWVWVVEFKRVLQ